MIETSEEINELATALAKAQAELHDAEKSSDNPFFKSKYADLAECLGQGRPVLAQNGLSTVQFPGLESEGWVSLTMRLMHSSGQWMQSTMSMPVQDKNVAQGSGSVLTYMRRYMYCAVVGISQVDSDANQAVDRSTDLPPPAERRQTPSKPTSGKEWYNAVEDDIESIRGALIGGKTPEQIVFDLRKDWKVSRKTGDRIKAIADELNAPGEQEDIPF